MNHRDFIAAALREDVGAGDFSTLASKSPTAHGKAILKIKEAVIIAGTDLAKEIFEYLQPDIIFTAHKKDGDIVGVDETAVRARSQ